MEAFTRQKLMTATDTNMGVHLRNSTRRQRQKPRMQINADMSISARSKSL